MSTIFLVDVDVQLSASLTKALTGDFVVKTFTHPKEAIHAFIEDVPAVVVTEIALGPLSGLEMIRQMRAYNVASQYIVFSAVHDGATMRSILQVCPDDLVDKSGPQAVPDLISAVRHAAQRAEKELNARGQPKNRRSAELLRALVDTLPSGLLVLDHEHHAVIWNHAAAQITAIDVAAVRGRHRDTLPALLKDLLDREQARITRTDASGETRFIEKTIQDIRLEGNKTNTVVIFTDTTALTNAQMDMEHYLMEMAETKDLLEEQAAQLAIALAEVDEKNAIIEAQNKRMVHELEMAGELQKSLLPDIYQSFNGVSFASKYISSIQIGGDLYDVVDLGQGLTGFLIADVSGHGVAAALVASMFKMSFHTHAANVASPKILFHMLNEEIKPILSEDYITAFYLIVDRTQNTLTYSNAGHPNPLLYRRETGQIIELDTNGYFIGMFEDGDYEEKTVPIDAGDALLLYTDCIIETENENGEQFGKQRLIDLFTRTIGDGHGQEVIDTIETELRAYCAAETLNDDFTCLLLEFSDLTTATIEIPRGDSHAGEFEEF